MTRPSSGSVEPKRVQSVADSVTWFDTESREHSGPQILARPLARVPLDPQVKVAAQIANATTAPIQTFHQTENLQALQLVHPSITEGR